MGEGSFCWNLPCAVKAEPMQDGMSFSTEELFNLQQKSQYFFLKLQAWTAIMDLLFGLATQVTGSRAL